MADTTSEVQIVFKGSTQSLDAALKSMAAGFATLGKSAESAGTGERKAAEGAAAVEAEAKGMARGVEVAADAMALLSKESSEATMRLYEVRSLAADMRGAFSNMGAAISGGMAAFAGVAAIGFLKQSADEAMQSQAAWQQLGTAIRGTGTSLEEVKKQIEDGRTAWERYGVTQGQVAAMTARGLGMGLSTKTILGDPKALADTAKLLGTDIPNALNAIARPRGANQVFQRLGLNRFQLQEMIQQTGAMSGDQRAQFVMQQVEGSRFAGQADAAADSATGKFLRFNTAMKDLREEVGNGILPAMTQLATALTNVLQTSDALMQPFGGLANVLKTLVVPLAGLLVLHFTGLGGLLLKVGQTLIGRLVGSFTQTATSIADADSEAAQLADDLSHIPETVATTATFDAATAMATKDAYIANIEKLMALSPVNIVSTFTPAPLTEPTATPITVPVTYNTTNAFSEATATPISIPVTYDTKNAFSEATATPISIPVTYDMKNAFHEAASHPINIPVTYDAKNAFKEATSHPINIPVRYNTKKAFHEASAHPINIPVGFSKTENVNGHPEPLNTVLNSEIASAQADARKHPITVPVSVSGGVHVTDPKGGYVDITPRLDPKAAAEEQTIRQEIQAGVNKGGPIPVTVKPQWQHDAIQGLKAGLAGGVAFGITDALFSGAVTIQHVNMPNVHMPPPTTGGGGGGSGQRGRRGSGGTADTSTATANLGPLAEALTMPQHGQRDLRVQVVNTPKVEVQGHPYVGIVPGQSINAVSATHVAGATTVTLPNNIDVKAHQAGSWKIDLNPDAFARMGQMILEMAVGSMIGNVLANLIPTDKILGLLGRAFKGIGNLFKGGKGGTGGGGPLQIPQTSSASEGDIFNVIEGEVVSAKSHSSGLNLNPMSVATNGVITMFKSVDWSAVGKVGAVVGGVGTALAMGLKLAASGGARMLGAVEGAVVTVFVAVFKDVQKALDTLFKQGSGGPRGAALINMGPLVSSIGLAVTDALLRGVQSASSALASIGKTIITVLMQGIRNALPGPVQGAFDQLTHNAYVPHHGHGGPTDTRKADRGGGWTGPGTTHIGAVTIHVNGARNPSDVADEVMKQLTELVGGVAAQRSLR